MARLFEAHGQIDQARHHDAALGIDGLLRLKAFRCFADGQNFAGSNGHIGQGVCAAGGV